jgi:hypothetical protein
LIIVFMVSPALKRRRYGLRNALTKGTPKWAKKNEHSADGARGSAQCARGPFPLKVRSLHFEICTLGLSSF